VQERILRSFEGTEANKCLLDGLLQRGWISSYAENPQDSGQYRANGREVEGSVRYIEKSDEKNVIYFNNDLDDMEKVVEEYLSSKYWFIEVRNVQENTAIIQKK